MTALTEDRSPDVSWRLQTHPEGTRIGMPVAASTTIYKGSFVGLDATGGVAAYVAPTSAITLQIATMFLGIADEHVDNSSGSLGDKDCTVLVDGMFQVAVSGAAVTNVGSPVYVTDSGAMSTAATGGAYAGRIWRFVESGIAIVRLASPLGSGYGEIRHYTTPTIDVAAVGDEITEIFPAIENKGGMIVESCYGYVTEVFAGTEDQGILLLESEVASGAGQGTGTTTGITLTGDAGGTPALDLIVSILTPLNGAAATLDNIIIVPAGKNLCAGVSQATSTAATGQIQLFVTCRPV
jgi:hypothetical protein